MRVLHVLTGIDPKLGGPPVAARNMVVAASRYGVEVELAACDIGGSHVKHLAADLRSKSVTLRSFPITAHTERLARWGTSAPMLRYLWHQIPTFDVVHIHGDWGLISLTGAARARLATVPTVLTPHEHLVDFDIAVSRSRWRANLKRIIGTVLVRLVDVIVFSSGIERRDSTIARVADSRVLAHPVVDGRALRPVRPASGDRIRVGFLGRLHPKKNLPALLDAVAQCADVELVIAGSGPAEAAYRERVRHLPLESRVTWLGFVAGSAKREFLDAIDVLAMPSLYEGFGVSAAEAMEAGVAVIVSDTVGVAAAVSDYQAGIVTGCDSRSIATAMARLRDDRALLNRYRSNAARAAREEFSFANFGYGIERIYSDLAERRGRVSAGSS